MLNGIDHTPEKPYCADSSCWCHTNITYHAEVENVLDRQPSKAEVSQLLSNFLGCFPHSNTSKRRG